MAVDNSVDPASWFAEQIGACEPDLLRTMAEALMGAEADAMCGAGYGERSAKRVNSRNGYRERDWDTRAGTVELAIPKLRSGSYFPDWLLERRRRVEQALVSVVATSYLLGVSTRRVDKLVEQLGIKGISKSQVSEMSKILDAQVTAFRNRALDAGPYAFVWMDALTQKVREGGRAVNVHVLVATGVNADGHREILGVEVTSSEDGAGRLAFPARAGRPGPIRRPTRHLRCPPWSHRGDRSDAARCRLAAVPHPLPAESADRGAQVGPAVGRHAGADHLRPAPH
jgi:transposase-like protein